MSAEYAFVNRDLCHRHCWSSLHVPPPTSTMHRASTSMYSLTFCIRVMSPECHHWKPAVQAVILRTPPSPAGH